MNEIVTVVNSVGFPIVAYLLMVKREEKLTTLLHDINVTLKGMDTRLTIMEENINE